MQRGKNVKKKSTFSRTFLREGDDLKTALNAFFEMLIIEITAQWTHKCKQIVSSVMIGTARLDAGGRAVKVLVQP